MIVPDFLRHWQLSLGSVAVMAGLVYHYWDKFMASLKATYEALAAWHQSREAKANRKKAEMEYSLTESKQAKAKREEVEGLIRGEVLKFMVVRHTCKLQEVYRQTNATLELLARMPELELLGEWVRLKSPRDSHRAS